jgi:hypothetical protein
MTAIGLEAIEQPPHGIPSFKMRKVDEISNDANKGGLENQWGINTLPRFPVKLFI